MEGITQIRPGLWRIGFPLGTVPLYSYLLVGERTLMVDAGLTGAADRVAELLTSLGRPAKLDWLVITHGHWDHMGAAPEIQNRLGAALAAHPAARPWLEDREYNWQNFYERFVPLYTPPAAIRERFDASVGGGGHLEVELHDGDLIDLGPGMTVAVLATPGHSPEGLSYYWEEQRVLFTGDTLVGEGNPAIPAQYESTTGYRASMARMRELRPEITLGGHRDALDFDGLMTLLDLCEATIDRYTDLFSAIVGYLGKDDLAALTKAFCDRLGKPVTVQAFITANTHLRGD